MLSIADGSKQAILVIQRATTDILALADIGSLQVSDEDKATILKQITEQSEGALLAYTHIVQRRYLASALDKLAIKNEIFDKILSNNEAKSQLIDMMLFGKYIFQYANNKDPINEKLYSNQFKACLAFFQSKNIDMAKLMQYCAESNNFLRILPLAYQAIATHDETLKEFRGSELVGHQVAYEIAKKTGQYKQLDVADTDGKVLESYSIQEITVVMPGGVRDQGLMGSILTPVNLVENPTLYIVWTGTYDSATAKADTERSAGEESYRRGEDQILQQIKAAVINANQRLLDASVVSASEVLSAPASASQMLQKPIGIRICGHSLGGALSQLTYHSIQRILALSIENVEIHEAVVELEKKFSATLQSPHERDLSGITLSLNQINEMTLAVWNATGVLHAVSAHTNALSPILVDAMIPQRGCFGLVGGDAFAATGQNTVLSNVPENKAMVAVLYVDPATTRAATTVAGIAGTGPASLVAFGTGPIGWSVAVVATAFAIGKTAYDKRDAHTMHHFKDGARPKDAYTVYSSHNADGIPNMEQCKGIREKLGYKAFINIVGANIISNFTSSALREQSEDEKFNLQLRQAQQQSPLAEREFLVSRIKSADPLDEGRVTRKIEQKEILVRSINSIDNEGDTLLHHAIDQGKFRLAQAILLMNELAIDQPSTKNGDTPFLRFMKKINTYASPGEEAYLLGIKMLNIKGIDLSESTPSGKAVKEIFDSWSKVNMTVQMWGSHKKTFMQDLAKRWTSTVPEQSAAANVEPPKNDSGLK